MKCEICKKLDAKVFIKHAADGVVRKLHVCEACAERKGVDLQLPIPFLADIIFGAAGDPKPPKAISANKMCPVCHLRRSHFRKTSLLGCPTCYEVFAEEVAPFLEGAPEGCGHVGKVPAREQVAAEVALLEKRLKAAVNAQNYEEAAQVRDRLQAVRSRGKKVRADA